MLLNSKLIFCMYIDIDELDHREKKWKWIWTKHVYESLKLYPKKKKKKLGSLGEPIILM